MARFDLALAAALLTQLLSPAAAAPVGELAVAPSAGGAGPWPNVCATTSNYSAWNQTACPSGASCCANYFSVSGMGCCPFPNAVCCPNRIQCCPQDTACVVSSYSPNGYDTVYTCQATGGVNVTTSKAVCKPGPALPFSTTKKNVLVVGDSVSIGYTPFVAQQLADIALVQHAPWDLSDGGAEETAYGLQCLDYFLASPSGMDISPDVVMFKCVCVCVCAAGEGDAWLRAGGGWRAGRVTPSCSAQPRPQPHTPS